MKKTVISLSVIVAAMSFGTMSEVCAGKKTTGHQTENLTASKVVRDKKGHKVAVMRRDSKGNSIVNLTSAALAAAFTKKLPQNTAVTYVVKHPSKSVGAAIQAAAAKSGASTKTDSEGSIHVSGTATQVAPTQVAAASANPTDPFNDSDGPDALFAVAAMAGMFNSPPPPPVPNVTANHDLDNDLDNDHVTMNNNSGTLSGMSVSGGDVTITQSPPPSVNLRLGVRTDVTDAGPYPETPVYEPFPAQGPGMPVGVELPQVYSNPN